MPKKRAGGLPVGALERPPHQGNVGQIGFTSYAPTLTALICRVEKDSEAVSKLSLHHCYVCQGHKSNIPPPSDWLLASRNAGSPSRAETSKEGGCVFLEKGLLPLIYLSVQRQCEIEAIRSPESTLRCSPH